MALLLDTQILVWLAENPDYLPLQMRQRIAAEGIVYFSTVSIWEMAIKIKIEKLKLSVTLKEIVQNFQINYSFQLLNIKLPHIIQTEQLPLHHRDPFDRLLIAQAIVEDVTMVSSGEVFNLYPVKRIW